MQISYSALIKTLLKLQSQDTTLDTLKAKSGEIPVSIDHLRMELAEEKNDLELKKEAGRKLLLRHKELETTLKTQEELIKKHQMELNQVKSNDAFRALMDEIESTKKAADETENAVIACLDEIEAAAKTEKQAADAITAEEARFAQIIRQLEEEKNGYDGEIKNREEDRMEFVKSIDTEVLRRYDYLRQRRGSAMSAAKRMPNGSATCSACNMIFPPQKQIELKKEAGLVFCDNCQRILYFPEQA